MEWKFAIRETLAFVLQAVRSIADPIGKFLFPIYMLKHGDA